MIEAEKQGFLEDEYIPYQESLDMKELGFDEPCFGYYKHTTIPNKIISNDLIIGFIKDNRIYNDVSNGSSLVGLGKGFISAPLYQQAFRWLLKHHNSYGVIIPTETMNWTFKTMTVVEGIVEVPPYKHVDAYDYNTYEEAELECLKKLIERIKNEP